MSGTTWTRVGALSAALAVAAGAFGAHALRDRLDGAMLGIFETGARYQMYHALALVAVGLRSSMEVRPRWCLRVSGWSFVMGSLLFSGSLYALAITGNRRLGAITPFGGVCFLIGWVTLAVGASAMGRPEADRRA